MRKTGLIIGLLLIAGCSQKMDPTIVAFDCEEMIPPVLNTSGVITNKPSIGLMNDWSIYNIGECHEGQYEGENLNYHYCTIYASKDIIDDSGEIIDLDRKYKVDLILSEVNNNTYNVINQTCKHIG